MRNSTRRAARLPGVLLVALLAAAPATASAEETAEPKGSIRIEVNLESRQKLPADVAAAIWESFDVSATCAGEALRKSRLRVGKKEDAPTLRVLAGRKIPSGTCTVVVSVDGASSTVELEVGKKTAKAKTKLNVSWTRISLKRVLDRDRAHLAWETDGEARTTPIGTDPVILPKGDYTVVVKNGGTEFEVATVGGRGGDATVDPYGTLDLSSVLLDRMRVELDGTRRFAKETMVLPARKWTIGLEAPGFRSREQSVDLRAGRTYRWTRKLQKAKPGLVTIGVSGPTEFTVELDGEEIELGEGPLEVATGRHRFTVKAPGYKSQSKKIGVAEGDEITLGMALTPLPIAVVVEGLPKGATVKLRSDAGKLVKLDVVDGKASAELDPGTWGLRIEAPDRVGFKDELVLEVGDGERVVTPDLPRAFVVLTFTGLPRGAIVTVAEEDNQPKPVEVEGDRARAKVAATTVTWVVEVAGKLPGTGTLELKPGDEDRDIAVELRPDPVFVVRIRTIVLAGTSGGLGVTGIILLAGSAGTYQAALNEHDSYLSLTDSDEVLAAKDRRDAAVLAGQRQQVAGIVLLGAGVGTAAVTVLTTLLGKKKPPVDVMVAPTEGGASFGISGRW